MEEKILVPYVDFVNGIQAMADLDSIRAIVRYGKYDSEIIEMVKLVLGFPHEVPANGTD
jgi:hypothetical protein